jgi:hypothetical protein
MLWNDSSSTYPSSSLRAELVLGLTTRLIIADDLTPSSARIMRKGDLSQGEASTGGVLFDLMALNARTLAPWEAVGRALTIETAAGMRWSGVLGFSPAVGEVVEPCCCHL